MFKPIFRQKRRYMITFIILAIILVLLYFGMDITIYNNSKSVVLYFTNFKGERKEVILWRK